jgi:polyisoprenoid-binding protein YceI
MNRMRAFRVGAALLFSASCAAAEEPEPAGLHYRIVPEGSELRWELPATLHTVHGTAPQLAGSVDAEPASGGDWRVAGRIAVRAAAMATGNASRDRNMREKVLETDRFPEIEFEVRRVVGDLGRFQPGQHRTVEVSGDLTVHGKTLPLRLPVDVDVLADHVLLNGSFPLNWKAYGLKDPSFGLVTVREPMKVFFRLEAVPAGDKR